MPSVQNGHFIRTDGSSSGASAELVCDDGYFHTHLNKNAYCLANGQWQINSGCVPPGAIARPPNSAPASIVREDRGPYPVRVVSAHEPERDQEVTTWAIIVSAIAGFMLLVIIVILSVWLCNCC